MKLKFGWNEFKNSDKIAVHCKTEDEANDFCREMHEQGMKWNSGLSYLKENNYHCYKKYICYYSDGLYGDVRYAKEINRTILEWSDYMNKQFTLEDLKPCMVIRLRSGEIGIISKYEGGICVNLDNGKWLAITGKYKNDLTNNYNKIRCKRLDIVEVYGFNELGFCANTISTDNRELLYKREEKSERELRVEELQNKLDEIKKELESLK